MFLRYVFEHELYTTTEISYNHRWGDMYFNHKYYLLWHSEWILASQYFFLIQLLLVECDSNHHPEKDTFLSEGF